jgi:hypothetical protein
MANERNEKMEKEWKSGPLGPRKRAVGIGFSPCAYDLPQK